MNKPKKALGIFVGTAALTLLVAVSAPYIGHEPTPEQAIRPVSDFTCNNRGNAPPTPQPTLVGEETTNDEPDSIPLTGIAIEPQKPNTTTKILTTKEPPRDKPTSEPSPPQTMETVAATEPQMGDTRIVAGQKQVYFLGFGWIEDSNEPNVCIVVDGEGDINKMVGTMDGGEVGRSCGDINKAVGVMD